MIYSATIQVPSLVFIREIISPIIKETSLHDIITEIKSVMTREGEAFSINTYCDVKNPDNKVYGSYISNRQVTIEREPLARKLTSYFKKQYSFLEDRTYILNNIEIKSMRETFEAPISNFVLITFTLPHIR